MNYKYEVTTDGGNTWAGNSLVFADKSDADKAGDELMGRWFAVTDYRVVETEEPVSHFFNRGTFKAERIGV